MRKNEHDQLEDKISRPSANLKQCEGGLESENFEFIWMQKSHHVVLNNTIIV